MVNNPKLHSKSRQRRSRAAAAADPPVSRLLSLVDSTRAAEIVDKVLKNRLVGDRSRAAAKLLNLRPDEVIFWPEHFLVFFTLAALEAGIDVKAYGARLNPKAASPEYIPGSAFRTVAQVAGVYAESHPIIASEDFSYVLEGVPGTIANLSTRPEDGPAFPDHSSRMVVNESALANGIAMYVAVALRFLERGWAL